MAEPRSRPRPDDRTDGGSSRAAELLAAARARRTMGSRRRRPTMTVFELLVVGVLGLGMALVFNAGALHRDAERLPFGAHRDRSLAVWGPLDTIAGALQLTRVRSEIDAVVDRGDNGAEGDPFAEGAPPPGGTGVDGGTPSELATTTTTVPVLREPTAAAPLRTYVAGDSMMQELGTAFIREAEGTGRFTAELDARVSTGLSRPDYYDWPSRFRDRIDALDPEVVVVMFGANDAQGLETADGGVIELSDVARWDEEYRRRVAATMDLLAGDDRYVYWLGQPPMREPTFAGRMLRLNAIYQSEAATRDRVTFVDATPLLGDADGGYQDVVEIDGTFVDLRQSDGIHLNLDGAARYGSAVLEIVEADIGG